MPTVRKRTQIVDTEMKSYVAAVVLNSAGHLLLTKHPQRAWELPGGRSRPKEYPFAAIRRIVREVSGLEISLPNDHRLLFGADCILWVYEPCWARETAPPTPLLPGSGWFTKPAARGLDIANTLANEVLKIMLESSDSQGTL
jgi:8-oxo-dGTP pyrophosphatase MutT (NUDIX family)